MIRHDETTPTDINAPTAPAESKPEQLTVAKPQQSISAVTAVEPDKTPTIATAASVQEAAPPRAAGGNLIMQSAAASAAPAVPLQQSQSAPQVLSPISTLKTG